MATTFHLPSTSPSLSPTSTPQQTFSDSDDDYDLPYPAELPRSAFLAEDFNPQTYLSTLRNRHQTLEDLRSDLRQRSQLLNKELLDLVNGNYEEFLSLGAGLKGGEEKVEGVRVGVLGFGREVQGIRDVVEGRKDDVESLIEEKKSMRRDVAFGRALLELVERVEEMEDVLSMRSTGDGEDVDQEDEDPDVIARLRRSSVEFELLTRLRDRIRAKGEHALIAALRPRILEIRRLLLLDLSSALKQAKSADDPGAVVEIMGCFSLLAAGTDGIRASRIR
jgi:hypothetical protein